MHTLTDAIEQQSDAIKQRLNESSERLSDHIERSSRRFIARFMLLIIAATAALFAIYKLS